MRGDVDESELVISMLVIVFWTSHMNILFCLL
jgi:hypothetical protein